MRRAANSLVVLVAVLFPADRMSAGEGQNKPVRANAEQVTPGGEKPVPPQTKIDPTALSLKMLGIPREIDSKLWNAARAKRANAKDIRCAETHHFIGGIDRWWGLMIVPQPSNQFHYWFRGIPPQSLIGTYEIKDGLAIFSGKLKAGHKGTSRSLRFGLNYAFLGDKVHFNLLIPVKDGSLQYRRKWFRKVDGQWKPWEEHKLTFIPGKHPQKALVFTVKGQRLRWDKDGQEKRDEIDVSATYQSPTNANYYRLQPDKVSWLPPLLWPRFQDNDKKGQPAVYLLSGHGHGQVSGFTWGDPPKDAKDNKKHQLHQKLKTKPKKDSTPVLNKKWTVQRLTEFFKKGMGDREVIAKFGSGRLVFSTSIIDVVQYKLADGRFLVISYNTGKLGRASLADESYSIANTIKPVTLELRGAEKPAPRDRKP